jgi:hypothetical protein
MGLLFDGDDLPRPGQGRQKLPKLPIPDRPP